MLRRHGQPGFSLVEVMIAMSVGLVMMGGLLNVYVATIRANTELMSSAHLDNELHKLLEMMARDLRRAGTHGNAQALVSNPTNPFGLDATGAYTGEVADSCLTFSYDWDNDGTLDTSSPDERYGFRLKAGAVQARINGLACEVDGTPNWENVTDPNSLTITSLQFTPTTVSADEIDVRAVRVVMNAQLTAKPEVTRSLSKTVRVRNDRYSP